ncbi:MAG: agmatinase [Deltaproteobacteria bacterium]|nr:MAG: agmatinase [Deltaproteobacteria bacterium]
MSAAQNNERLSVEPLMGAALSFGGRDAAAPDLESAQVAIIPVPYDSTTTYLPGTRHGPIAILRASQQLELFDEETSQEILPKGIGTLEELEVDVGSPRAMVDRVRSLAEKILDYGLFPLMLGGEHLLSLGMIQATAERLDDLSILQLDAHADLRETYQGTRFSNACAMRLASGHGNLISVGVRSISAEEHRWARDHRVPIYYATDLREQPNWQEEVVARLGPRVYITIDLDVFDPAIMPAVGTPEPGGLGWYEVLDLLRLVSRDRRVVGADIMELCPHPGNIAPDFFAAKLALKLLVYCFQQTDGQL